MDSKNIVGIVPAFREGKSFNAELPDCLLPLREDYCLLERAVEECLVMGASSVWVVTDGEDFISLTKNILGDYKLYDGKKVPIFFFGVPATYSVERRRLSFSLLYSAYSIHELYRKSVGSLTPDIYYMCSPFTVYDATLLKGCSADIQEHGRVTINEFNDCLTGISILRADLMTLYEKLKEARSERFKKKFLLNEEELDILNETGYNVEKMFGDILQNEFMMIETPAAITIKTWQDYTKCLTQFINIERVLNDQD